MPFRYTAKIENIHLINPKFSETHSLASELCDSLGAFGDSVLGELAGENKTNGGGRGRDVVVGGGWRRRRVGAVGESSRAVVVVVLALEGGRGRGWP